MITLKVDCPNAAKAAFFREQAEAYVAENKLPLLGVVVFFEGKLCGWMRSIEIDRAANGHTTHVPGCIAVTVAGSVRIFEAFGGNDDAGAELWVERAIGGHPLPEIRLCDLDVEKTRHALLASGLSIDGRRPKFLPEWPEWKLRERIAAWCLALGIIPFTRAAA